MKTNISITALLLTIFFVGCGTGKKQTQNNMTEQKVDSVLALMTLDEKIGQMTQYAVSWDLTGPPSNMDDKEKLDKIKRGMVGSMLKVVSVKATRETQRLVMGNSRLKIPMIFGYDVIHGFKTIFPVPLGESASWDLKMIRKSAEIAAKEASAAGINWTFAPMLDVSRDARWGRIMEGAGEDPYLGSMIAVARVKGFQGDDLSNDKTIAACAKHFAGYGFAEAGMDYNTVNVGIHELHNAILPPFKAAAKAGVATFMNSFNEIDGIPSTGNRNLQRDILKGDWNWNGFIVSDWGSIVEMINHGYAKDKKHAAEIAVKAGCDMDMESYAYNPDLKTLVEEGKVPIDLIDDAVRRILRIKFDLGLFDDPYKYCNEEREKDEIYTKENLKLAREVAKRSIVLLKNDGRILPLEKKGKTIAVIGPLADDKDSPLGNWRAQGVKNSAVSLLEGIKKAVGENTKIIYAKGCDLTISTLKEEENQFLMPIKFNTTDRSGFPEAIRAARKADVVIMAIGEDAYQTGEGRSQVSIELKGLQTELLKAVYKVNKNIVVVLMNGRPLSLKWESENIPAILECWLLGSESGNAIADVLFGDYNPSGKLPVSFPYSVGQEPLYYNHKNTGRPFNPEHVTYTGYRDSPKTALYPFGFGLSYTDFEYSNLKTDRSTMKANETALVTVDVKNTGERDGEEVIQLYIHDVMGSLTRPVRELKGFQKIFLKAGETKTVSFKIDRSSLEFYTASNKWEVEPGDFEIFVGGDSKTEMKVLLTVEK